MNNRRKLVIALGAGALAMPLASFAQQQAKVWRVGVLLGRRPASIGFDPAGDFLQRMRELGYVEGKNLAIEWRSAEGQYERLPSLAIELVNLKVDVIVTAGTPPASAAQKTTTTIPIVMINAGDPVDSGFIKSLAPPGGNMTGLTNISVDILPKQLEMLLGMVPNLSRVAVLVNPGNPDQSAFLKNIEVAAQSRSVKILPVEARTPQEIDRAFSVMSREKAGAVIVAGDGLFLQQRRQVAELAAAYRLPSVSTRRENVEAGYLMSYGPNPTDVYRRAAVFVDKILRGAKPGELPVERVTVFELVINLKTARALGIKIPDSILLRADKVIE